MQVFTYNFASTLAPGEAIWSSFGPADAFAKSAVTASAIAHDGSGGTTHVLRVDDFNTWDLEQPGGDLPTSEYYVGCNITNNGSTTINNWSVVLGVIIP